MKIVKLDDICEINIGKTPARKNNDYWGKGHKWVSISDMNSKFISKTKEQITDLAIDETKIKLVPKGTVIMSFKLSIGKVAIAAEPLYTNEAIAHFIPKVDNILPEYLYYVLQFVDYEPYINKAAKGKTLNKKTLKKVKIPLFDLKIQKMIIRVLDNLCNIIEKRNKQLEEIEDLKQSIFSEMFMNPNRTERIEKKTFGDICRVNQGLQIPIADRLKEPEDNAYLYITNQYLNGSKDAEYIKNPKESVICTKEDILVSRTGNTGHIVTGVDGVFHNNFFKLNYDDNKFNRHYLFYYLNQNKVQGEMKRLAGTSTIPDLNHSDFYSIEVKVPSLSLQNEFSEKVKEVEAVKEKMQASLDEMNKLFDALMQKAFTGELV